ncbi:LCP family protein, partial [Actinocrinis puniceicyclus]
MRGEGQWWPSDGDRRHEPGAWRDASPSGDRAGHGRQPDRGGGIDGVPRRHDVWRPPSDAGTGVHGGRQRAEDGRRPPAARCDSGARPARRAAWDAPSSHGAHRPGRINPDIDLDELDPSGHARRTAAAGRTGRGRPAGRKRKALKWVSLSLATVLLAVLGAGEYLYVHLSGNIKSTSLLPDGVTQAGEVPNRFGQSPLNILLLGNGGRVNAQDCRLGGACADTASAADTMMVVHLAADRSNMTVMSIPRDSIVHLPACAHDPTDLINASLVHGPACAVQTVHDITGLTIDHFIEIDMSGVVTMSNALGGVPVCVTNNVYDSYSHLKLPKGTSVIQGTQALAWLRTRHAFINEVYREQAQHMFLAALLRKLKANASLTHVTTLYSVADAATKALTVDSGLGSVLDLLSLAQEIGKVPTSRVTMLSVPTIPYAGPNPAWKQQLQFDQPAADSMFAALKSDTPYTKP